VATTSDAGVLGREALGLQVASCAPSWHQGIGFRIGGTFAMRTVRLSFGDADAGQNVFAAGGVELEIDAPIAGSRVGVRTGYEAGEGHMTTAGIRWRSDRALLAVDAFRTTSTMYDSSQRPYSSTGLMAGIGGDFYLGSSDEIVDRKEPRTKVDDRTAEVYLEGTAGYGGTNQSLLRFALGARLGIGDERLNGPNLRIGATVHVGNSEVASSGIGAEAEANLPYNTTLRYGVRAGYEIGGRADGAEAGGFGYLGVVGRVYGLALHVDGFRSRPGDNFGANPALRYGAMVGIGVGGNPRWYEWVALGVVGLMGAAWYAAEAKDN
jgi:hypothetical protein